MTPWNLRRRLRGWICTKLVGFDPITIFEDNQPEPPPLEPQDNVTLVDDDAPTLPDEAQRMLAGVGPAGRHPIATMEPEAKLKPLAGSVEERLAQYRLR